MIKGRGEPAVNSESFYNKNRLGRRLSEGLSMGMSVRWHCFTDWAFCG